MSDPGVAAISSKTAAAVPTSPADLEERGTEKQESIYRTQTGATTVIPRCDRWGLLASWTLIPEIEDPKLYSPRVKNFIVFIVAAAAMAGPLSCGIMFPALPEIERDLETTSTVSNLSVALFLLGMGTSPLWLAYISEHYGRRTVYLVTFTTYVIFTIASGFSQNITQLLIFRIFAALSSGSAQALGAGTIADIYVTQERGHAISWFYLGPLVAPLLAPVLGGLVTAAGTWRNTQWLLAAFGAATLLLLTFCLPETLHDLKPIAVKRNLENADLPPTRTEMVTHTLLDPFRTFAFFKYPAVTCSVFFAGLNFGGLYIMNISIEYAFSRPPYNFTTIIFGCVYLGNSLGYIIGSIVGGRWSDKVLIKAQKKAGGAFVPERRIGVNAWTGAVLAPCGILLYGWTIDIGLWWFIPLIGTFFFGLGTMFIYASVTTYLIDVLPGRSSSAMALNNFVRCVLACIGAIVAVPAINVFGYGILLSIVAGIMFASVFLVLAIVKKGDAWRERTRKASLVV